MAEIDSYFAIDRIFVADRMAKNRTDSRAAVFYLTTLYHKREVAIRLKTYLSKYPHLRISVNDCFPTEEALKAMALNRMAYVKRQNKSVTRTRVVNRRGQAILQEANKKGEGYRDVEVDDDDMEPYLQQQDQQNGKNKTNSRRRKYNSPNNKQDKESRDQEKADKRRKKNGQSNGLRQHQQQLFLNNTPVGRKKLASAMPTGNNSQTQLQQTRAPFNSAPSQQMTSPPHPSQHHLHQQHLQPYNNSGQYWPPQALPVAQGGQIYQMIPNFQGPQHIGGFINMPDNMATHINNQMNAGGQPKQVLQHQNPAGQQQNSSGHHQQQIMYCTGTS